MKTERIFCRYDKCKHEFEKPVMLTLFHKKTAETYYACPHCFTKIDFEVEGQSLDDSVSVDTSDSAREKAPSECPHQFGYLKTLPKGSAIPDVCLTCPRLLQCYGYM